MSQEAYCKNVVKVVSINIILDSKLYNNNLETKDIFEEYIRN